MADVSIGQEYIEVRCFRNHVHAFVLTLSVFPSRDHSYWRFGTGNKQTLWDDPLARGEDVRTRLIEWQEKHYSANLMKLVVLGKGA